ncbi:MAG: DUF3644 domain-containing protein [Atopobiaceae bacterium]|jgi:hypothetical protein|nr:DUF3644 domain-containing protein [Atopobiaceae bacterium]
MHRELNNTEQATVDRLLEKSQEVFLLSIELYNRPTIRYHIEGCAFFLCNAWELMLKACIIKKDGIEQIYYPEHKDRTLSLEDCLKKIYTNKYDPLRINMDKIIDLRNTSTHFILDEYEVIYAPLLQACVSNYDEQLRRLHEIEISDKIPENYLILSVRKKDINEEECRARYSQQDLEKMLKTMDGISTTANEINNERFSCTYVVELRSTKKSASDLTFKVSGDSDTPVAMVKTLVHAKEKYPYRPKKVVKEINKRIKKNGITLLQNGIDTTTRAKSKDAFNMYHFGLFTSFYSMKNDNRYSYNAAFKGETPSFIYSQQAVDLIWEKIKEDPKGIIDSLKKKVKKGSA